MKKITIEKLLTWAFTQELCKVGGGNGGSGALSSSFLQISAYSELGTLVDRTPNAYGVIPTFDDEGEPSADAVLVGDTVRALGKRGAFDIADGWNPFPEWADDYGLIAAEVQREVSVLRLKGERLAGKHICSLMITHAVLGRGPDWKAIEPEIGPVQKRGNDAWFVMRSAKDAFGRAYRYEADGYDAKRKRPHRNAYHKMEIKAPIMSAIQSRLDWQLWQDGLFVLHEALEGRLSAHELICFTPDRQPWVAYSRQLKNAQAIEIA